MSLWKRCFGKSEQQGLAYLLRRKLTVEQRGCFSDRELDEKEYELTVLDRRIKAIKNLQFRLRTQAMLQQLRA
ncbi:MAG: hypothetical protein O7G88_11805 [bacterium]|nr:hypothetical protein [bacterium]